MAIVQISQITNRKGLAENLPQLTGGELGWSIDTRQLWIGNGTLEEGAPTVGNTEILTEFSDILAFTNTYTFKGQDAGYIAQTGIPATSQPPYTDFGAPTTQSLQSWLDQFVSIKDFGAVGDGVTDDTAAINNALYQIYCREVNPQIRRSLFFPAGVYLVSASILIPPYATLYGEGNNNSVIAMSADVNDYVARTADNLQQTGVNIGAGGTTPPESITVTNMGFTHLSATGSVFLVEDATGVTFQNVGFRGASTAENLTSDVNGSIGVSFASTNALVTEGINFSQCEFSGLVWAGYSNQQIKGITFANSKLDTLYQGFRFGTAPASPNVIGTVPTVGANPQATLNASFPSAVSGNGVIALDTGDLWVYNGSTWTDVGPVAPTGIRIVNNLFDNVYAEGILFGQYTKLNASGHNIFYNVGNHFSGPGYPATAVINIQNSNNVSIADMFARSDADAAVYPRINLNSTASIATTNGEALTQGTYTRLSGGKYTLINSSNGTILTFNTAASPAITIDYTITRVVGNNLGVRTGTIQAVQPIGNASPTFTDTTVQNANVGITLNVSGNTSVLYLDYSASNAVTNGTIAYSIKYLA
jgi:hypothetical protein